MSEQSLLRPSKNARVRRQTDYYAECDVCPSDEALPERRERWRVVATTRNKAERELAKHTRSGSHAMWSGMVGGALVPRFAALAEHHRADHPDCLFLKALEAPSPPTKGQPV